MPSELILASGSPRRRELLQRAGYRFRVVVPDAHAECGLCSGESPVQFVRRMAYQKAANVATKVGDALVIGCDTVAECQGVILGKPRDEWDAGEILRRLRGRSHRVLSGLCLWPVPAGELLIETAVSHLFMDPLSDTQIAEYLLSGQWEGKAGAFGYQDGIDWVHLVEGSESNVVGLPMELLGRLIEELAPNLLPGAALPSENPAKESH